MSAKAFRVGDPVRIMQPDFVVRVGYPTSASDYLPRVYGEEDKLQDLLHALGIQRYGGTHPRALRTLTRIRTDLAYLLALERGFGGRERTIHTKVSNWHHNHLTVISKMRTVQTGTYYPPQSSGSGEDYDYTPGGLHPRKTHRLATVSLSDGEREIEVTNLKHASVGKAHWASATGIIVDVIEPRSRGFVYVFQRSPTIHAVYDTEWVAVPQGCWEQLPVGSLVPMDAGAAAVLMEAALLDNVAAVKES